MMIEIVLAVVYLVCGIGAYRAYRQDGQSQVFSTFVGFIWPIPVLFVYLMMGLNSQTVLAKIKAAIEGVRK